MIYTLSIAAITITVTLGTLIYLDLLRICPHYLNLWGRHIYMAHIGPFGRSGKEVSLTIAWQDQDSSDPAANPHHLYHNPAAAESQRRTKRRRSRRSRRGVNTQQPTPDSDSSATLPVPEPTLAQMTTEAQKDEGWGTIDPNPAWDDHLEPVQSPVKDEEEEIGLNYYCETPEPQDEQELVEGVNNITINDHAERWYAYHPRPALIPSMLDQQKAEELFRTKLEKKRKHTPSTSSSSPLPPTPPPNTICSLPEQEHQCRWFSPPPSHSGWTISSPPSLATRPQTPYYPSTQSQGVQREPELQYINPEALQLNMDGAEVNKEYNYGFQTLPPSPQYISLPDPQTFQHLPARSLDHKAPRPPQGEYYIGHDPMTEWAWCPSHHCWENFRIGQKHHSSAVPLWIVPDEDYEYYRLRFNNLNTAGEAYIQIPGLMMTYVNPMNRLKQLERCDVTGLQETRGSSGSFDSIRQMLSAYYDLIDKIQIGYKFMRFGPWKFQPYLPFEQPIRFARPGENLGYETEHRSDPYYTNPTTYPSIFAEFIDQGMGDPEHPFSSPSSQDSCQATYNQTVPRTPSPCTV